MIAFDMPPPPPPLFSHLPDRGRGLSVGSRTSHSVAKGTFMGKFSTHELMIAVLLSYSPCSYSNTKIGRLRRETKNILDVQYLHPFAPQFVRLHFPNCTLDYSRFAVGGAGRRTTPRAWKTVRGPSRISIPVSEKEGTLLVLGTRVPTFRD